MINTNNDIKMKFKTSKYILGGDIVLISVINKLTTNKKIKEIHSKASEISSEMPWGDILIAFAPLAAEIAADVVVKVSCACVARFGCASTGTPIKCLNGAAKNNAILARIGGGSLAKKGMGIGGGKIVLNCMKNTTRVVVSTGAYTCKVAYDYKKS